MDDEVGASIKARRVRLGMSVSALAKKAGVYRETLAALERPGGDTSAQERTIGAVEAALDQLETEMGMNEMPARAVGDPADDLVEFTIEGNFGVRAVVKGPVRDMDELLAAVDRLIHGMGGGPDRDDSGKS